MGIGLVYSENSGKAGWREQSEVQGECRGDKMEAEAQKGLCILPGVTWKPLEGFEQMRGIKNKPSPHGCMFSFVTFHSMNIGKSQRLRFFQVRVKERGTARG